MQHVRARGGVAFYDDSKATNVGASVAALDGLGELEGRVVLIAGGVDKGGSWAPLVERMRKKGRAVVVIGEATPVVEAAFEGSGVALRREKTMDDAVAAAAAVAIAGDVVLLAPACASFDMFTSYADRGRAFTKSVLELSALDEVAP
jgi:UDP-N-acetylmuramoylalanine--D-glutamate ligase